MDQNRPSSRQLVEQIEILERTVEESRRPLTTTEALSYQPQSSVRRSFEQFVYPDPERRFNLTNERDAGRDASLLYSPSGPNSFSSPLHHSTPEQSTALLGQQQQVVNQYGYDMHTVQISAGGARVVETHGSGHLIGDRSLAEISAGDQPQQRSPPSAAGSASREAAKSILKQTTPPDTSWRKSPSSEGSLHRKDSYRQMQDQQEQQHSFYGQSSNATILSKASKQPIWSGLFEHRLIGNASGHGQLGRLKESINELSRQMREGEWSPRLVAMLVLAGLFAVLILLLLWFLVSSIFFTRSTFDFWLYPPPCAECQRRSASAGSGSSPGTGSGNPSHLFVRMNWPAQAQFELVGNPPFKSNSFTTIDFDTGYVAIADHALTDDQGLHATCFIMQLDRSALPEIGILQDALENTYSEVHSEYGWQEYWQYTVEEVDRSFANGKFRERVDDCAQARWYFLKHAVYTRDASCSYCYDFCLPDYAVLRRQKYEDTAALGIRRLNCFRLYVPEWSKYQVQTDAQGGHWQYPVHAQNTQRDARGRWVDWRERGGESGNGGGMGTNPMARRRRR